MDSSEGILQLFPEWYQKLPTNIQLIIVAALVIHLAGLALLVYLGLRDSKSSRPDFKAKLT